MTKDKLVKFHHKAPFYRLRKCAVFSACFFGAAATIAVPISIHIVSENEAALKAEQEVSSSENNEVNSDEITSNVLAAY